MRIEIILEADRELYESAQWYEDQQKGLSDKFIAEVAEKILSIADNPEIYPKSIGLKQEAVLKIFPFIILFRVIKSKNVVYILAVFHTSRNPKLKFGRKLKS